MDCFIGTRWQFFFTIIDDIDVNDMRFQQDDATSHITTKTLNLLRTKFSDPIISHNSAINWPSRSCDLTPLDYFLSGYVKDQIYADNPQSIDALKANIRRVISDIEPQLCNNAIQSCVEKINVCKRGHRGHLCDTICSS